MAEEDIRRSPRGGDPLEERLDRWVNRGRRLVDGVSGARPGSRGVPRGGERRGGRSGGAALNPSGLGRWVEERLDWFLEDGDDWREPWQEGGRPAAEPSRSAPEPARSAAAPAPGRRRLEAISRRGTPSASRRSPEGPAHPESEPEAWPEDQDFSLPRWRREETTTRREPDPQPPLPSGGRPLPRSSRRR